VHPLGRPREMQDIGKRQNVAQAAKVHHDALPRTHWNIA
jgi:hypothetical protein